MGLGPEKIFFMTQLSAGFARFPDGLIAHFTRDGLVGGAPSECTTKCSLPAHQLNLALNGFFRGKCIGLLLR